MHTVIHFISYLFIVSSNIYSALLVLKFSGFSSNPSPSRKLWSFAKSLSSDRLAQDINLRPAPVNVARALWFSYRENLEVPSGNLLHSYWLFIVGLLIKHV